MIFLRDGLVPEDRPTALQLYREAAFWRLETLQRAIEEAHLDLTRTSITVDRVRCHAFVVTSFCLVSHSLSYHNTDPPVEYFCLLLLCTSLTCHHHHDLC